MIQTQEQSKQLRLQNRISILVTIALVFSVALCLYTVVQVLSRGYVNIGGFMMFRVVTGSMEPTIPVGALLITKEVDISGIRVDDIVCFRTEVAEIWGRIVTHRVVNIFEADYGGILLETKGDANLVADGYLVDELSFVGKVVWHTGDGSVLANLLALFTSKIGFLGCIVLPVLLLSALILRDSVSGIQQQLQLILEIEQQTQAPSWENDPLCGMTPEEYQEMYERIRAELMEELKYLVETQEGQELCSKPENKTEDGEILC